MVLIVDDHELTRRALTALLRQSGYDVRTAPSGHAARHFLSQFRPDAIVLDLSLPDMSGIDVLEWMRKDPSLAQVPVLVFSGDPDYLDAVSDLGVDTSLVKGSVSWGTLVEELRRLTSQERISGTRSARQIFTNAPESQPNSATK